MAMYQGKERSPGKIAARAWCYSKVRPNKLYRDKHIVIASRECGDIRYLIQDLGVAPRNILACDIDPVAMQSAALWSVEVSSQPNIVKTVAVAKSSIGLTKLASINVDLCMTIDRGAPILNDVLDQAGRMVPVFFTFLRGRDNMSSTEERLTKLEGLLTAPIQDFFCYQSSTRTSVGSPMCVAQF